MKLCSKVQLKKNAETRKFSGSSIAMYSGGVVSQYYHFFCYESDLKYYVVQSYYLMYVMKINIVL